MSERPRQPVRLSCPDCQAVFRTGFQCCPTDGAELGPWEADPLVGSEIANRYIIDELVGEGSMGLIYRAHHVRLPRIFALKILFGDLVADQRMRIRFAQEAALASRLSHPNVVPVVDFGRSDRGLLYLAMDYVEGESLCDLIEREAPLHPRSAILLARKLAQGLGHAHEHGLVHRDFKPGNVVLEPRDDGPHEPRILDFGLAISTRELGEHEEVPGRLTECGFIVGTPIYIAPEQALDRPVDHRADLFALGVVIYEMLAGKPPFDGRPVEVAHKNVTQPVPPIGERSPGTHVPPQLERVVRRLVEKDPNDRYRSAEALCDALDAAERELYDETSVIAEQPGWDDLLARQARPLLMQLRRPRSLAVAGAVMFAGAAIAFWLAERSETDAATLERPAAARKAADSRSGPAESSPAPARAASAPGQTAPTQPAAVAGPVPIAPDMVDPAVVALSVPPPVVAPLNKAEPPAAAPEPAEQRAPEPAEPRAPRQRAQARATTAQQRAARARERARREDEATEDEMSGRVADQNRALLDELGETEPAAAPAEGGDHAVETLIRDYREVGESIDRLQSRGGEQAARAFRDRYFRLPYGDALRIPAVRRDTLSALARLRKEVLDAMERTPAPGAARPNEPGALSAR
jgi:Protein kinase domain